MSHPPQQGGHPPQQGAYPPPGGQPGYGGYGQPQPQYGAPGYGGYGSQPGYPPQHGSQPGYPPQHGSQPGYPPQQHGSQPGYPPQQGAYPPQGSMYPPQGGAHPGQPPAHLSAYGQQYYGMIDQSRMLELRGFFASVDKDRSGSITAVELTSLQFGGKRFSLDTAKKLVKVFDVDKSGSISFEEYAALHQFVMSMQASFYQFDRDGSGKLDEKEVTQALVAGGFQLNEKTVADVIKKFKAAPTGGRFAAQGLDFEQFLQMAAFLGQIRSTFMLYDTNRSGWIQINLEQLVQINTAM